MRPKLDLGVELAGAAHQHLGVGVDDLLDHRAKLEELDLAALLVEARLDLLLGPELAARRLLHRLLEGLDDGGLVDALVLGDLVDLALERDDVHFLTSAGCAFAKSSRVNS